MAISIASAYKNIMSKAYDKNSLLKYVLVIAVAGIFDGIMTSKGVNTYFTVLSAVVYALILIFSNGVINLSAHRAYLKEENIFPDLGKDIEEIMLTACKFLGGSLIIALLVVIISAVLLIVAFKLHIILGCIASVALVFFLIVFLTCLSAGFVSTLKFSEWFNFGKVFNIMGNNLSTLMEYILNEFLIGLISFAVMVPIIIIVTIPLGVIGLSVNHSFAENLSSIAGGLIGTVIGSFAAVFNADITGQFLNAINKTAKVSEPPVQE